MKKLAFRTAILVTAIAGMLCVYLYLGIIWEVFDPPIYPSLEFALSSPDQVRKLMLHNQGLTEVPAEVKLLKRLRCLYLPGNKIHHLPEWLVRNPRIISVWLDSNQISRFPPELLGMSQLRALHLNDNHIGEIPGGINRLSLLEDLKLENNQLAVLPPEIWQLKNLTTLFVGNNQLKELPPQIARLSCLEFFRAPGNKLKTLPSQIGQCRRLERLILGQNLLSTIPPEIGRLKRLEGLDLGDNRLTDFPDEISQLRALEWLVLEGNDLPLEAQKRIRRLLPHTKIEFGAQRLEPVAETGRAEADRGNLGRVAPGDCSPGVPADPHVQDYRMQTFGSPTDTE